MNKSTFSAAIALFAAVSIFVLWSRLRPTTPTRPQRASMNAEGRKMLALRLKEFQKYKSELEPQFNQADKVETFRVQMPLDNNIAKGVSGWPIVAKGPTLNNDFATRLGAIVLDAETYEMPGQDMKLCWFDPNVAFRVWKGKQSLDVLICFGCTQLVVVEKNPRVPERSMGGDYMRFRIGGDFPRSRQQLLNLCREVFPSDPKIK